jgi:hypothetical protein
MQVRKRVEAEMALTNTLGIRDNLYAGPITQESMFNVFPFENTINIMYLSGDEVQELTDYVAQRSGDRGCQSQAQVSGMTFIMDCAQYQLNLNRYPCGADITGTWGPAEQAQADAECNSTLPAPQHPDGWQCTQDHVCWAHLAYSIGSDGNPTYPTVNGVPVVKGSVYKIAVNDYIAKGGSGYKVLKRNTTRIETGLSLRDGLIDYLRGQCTCQDILDTDGNPNSGLPDDQRTSSAGSACARSKQSGNMVIDPLVKSWCGQATNYQDWRANHSDSLPGMSSGMCACADVLAGTRAICGGPWSDGDWQKLWDFCSLSVGKCTCASVLASDEKACGHVTDDLRQFCANPTTVAIAIAEEDGRIGARVK